MSKVDERTFRASASGYTEFDMNVDRAELIHRLQINALHAHQVSVGRGDELVRILQRTIRQLERTHNRIQAMSIALFLTGVALLGVAVYEGVVATNSSAITTAVLGGAGTLAAFVATFWTTPVDKISDSIADLVKLETAFLGYIRVIGEVDSAFQMQYLDLLARGGESGVRLDQLTQDTKRYVSDSMRETVELIDKHTLAHALDGDAVTARLSELEDRLRTLESKTV